jgi:polynucleotide 5'-hydroxyl-kinase GRC3/NOL9
MKVISDHSWENLFSHAIKVHGPIMIIGDTDTGKSTLIRYFIRNFLDRDTPVSLVDSDVGQSSLGLPGTVCSKVFRTNNDYNDFMFKKMCYVGTVNPSENINSSIHSTTLLANFCREKTHFVLIDTTGLIAGTCGIALKLGKIKSIHPTQIVALQHNDELEHILAHIEKITVHRLTVSPFVKIRTRDNRVRYRNKKLYDYFLKGQLSEFLMDTHTSQCIYNGKLFHPKESSFPEKTLIGLNDGDETHALGVITDMNNKFLTFIAPIQSLERINRVVFGNILIGSYDFEKIKNHMLSVNSRTAIQQNTE